MRIQLTLISFLLISPFCFGKPSFDIIKGRKPAEIETIASWTMKAPDNQNFALHEDKFGDQITKALTFSIGEKNQRTFPVDKSVWDKWRTRLVRLMSSLGEGKRCPHPMKLEISRKGSKSKSKNICLDEITESERNEIQKLVTEWNEYLYGKE